MSGALLMMLALLAGAGALVGTVLYEGRTIDELDPRVGEIVYEDVEKPKLDGLAEAVDQEGDDVRTLYYVDEEFAVPLQDEERTIRLVLKGKADRVIRKSDGGVHIIDFKSGTSGRPAEDEAFPEKVDYYRFQLMAYFLMLEQSLGELPRRAIVDFVDEVADFVQIDNTPEIREECFQLIRELAAVKLGQIPEEWLAQL